MINYPIKKSSTSTVKYNNTANRGMALEEMINRSNDYYSLHDIAYVSKRPTSVKILKTEGGCRITDAVFLAPSTLDYVGVYQGRYLDFEAKETTSNKGFPLANVAKHQIEAMEKILKHGGITFAIIFLKAYNKFYLLDGQILIDIYNSKSKIIPYETLNEIGHLIKEGYNIPVDYIKVVKEIYIEK